MGATESGTELRGWSADVVFLDETDGYEEMPEGDVMRLATRGVRAAPEAVRRVVAGSTPTVTGDSLIDDIHDAADLRFEYLVPCPECGAMHPLAFGSLRWPEEGEAKARAGAAACLCPSCGVLWPWEKLPGAIEAGRWQAGDAYIEGGELRGAGADWPESVGFAMDAADRIKNCVGGVVSKHWSWTKDNVSYWNGLPTWGGIHCPEDTPIHMYLKPSLFRSPPAWLPQSATHWQYMAHTLIHESIHLDDMTRFATCTPWTTLPCGDG